jgi:pimeloyl-ACP methyl ester carboxylesterase
VLGHAFGHMLASVLTTDHPDMVKAVIFGSAQGANVPEDIATAPFVAGDPSVPEAERLATLRKAFFAPGHDASIWLKGWYPETLKRQRAAAKAVNRDDFRACGNVPLLELIAACDPFNSKPSWPALREQLGPRVTTQVIDDASHALFPEQPDKVAETVISWAASYRSGH